MAKFLSLCIMLLAASISVSAQTYTVLHNFGSETRGPRRTCTPRNHRPKSWRRNVDHYARFSTDDLGKAFRITDQRFPPGPA